MPMTGGDITITLKNSLSELDTLRRKLEDFGNSLGISKKSIFKINLAMEELFSNIVSHGYQDDAEHWIKIIISYLQGALTLRIEDDGIPFNPLEARAPDLECPLEEREIGGLGCYLVRCLVNEISYKRSDNKNVLNVKIDMDET